MRALVFTAALLTSFSLSPLLAQDQGKPPASPQPAQASGQSNASTTQPNDEKQKKRLMERMGPAMDWDHRKTGRDLEMAPRRESGDTNHQKD